VTAHRLCKAEALIRMPMGRCVLLCLVSKIISAISLAPLDHFRSL
jgi:hypothetical protein